MPVIGERKSRSIGKGYQYDPMYNLAESYLGLYNNLMNESGYDLATESSKVLMNDITNETMRNYFVENSVDPSSLAPAELDDHFEMMNEQYKNDREAVLEYSNVAAFNPVIGMTFPIHKNILMNCIFDKGAIPKVVAKSPKFTITMENRFLVGPDGTKVDMWREQKKMTAIIDATAPFTEVAIKLPENRTTDVLAAINGSQLDNLSIQSSISAIMISGDANDLDAEGNVWVDTDLVFKPGYGDTGNRILMEQVTFKQDPENEESETITDVISGTMLENKFQIFSGTGKVLAVKLKTRLDTSNHMQPTASVKWDTNTDIIEIPSYPSINVPISPEEVKDISALYQVNQLTKVMSMIKIVMENYKDDKIKMGLDTSFNKMSPNEKISRKFDFKPREGYALDYVEWRYKVFFDSLDTYVTDLLTVLNDPNVVVTVFGRPDLIRKITPTEYTYQSPSNIGPVELEFTKTVVTSDKRTYQFMSSQKLNGSNELIIILCPRNTERFIYRIFDYQMYVSNEIRNAQNPTLPAVTAFERWLFKDYQPVQGRVEILNPMGYEVSAENGPDNGLLV